MGDGVPIEEWTGELSYRARLSRRDEVAAKASLNRALVRWDRPETRRSIHALEDWTDVRWNARGWLVDRGEIPIELGDSWFSPK